MCHLVEKYHLYLNFLEIGDHPINNYFLLYKKIKFTFNPIIELAFENILFIECTSEVVLSSKMLLFGGFCF